MCVNRSWSNIDSCFSEIPTSLLIRGRRSDGNLFIHRIDLKNLAEGYDLSNAVINGIRAFETYRNCECPNNKECHTMIDGKLNVVVAHDD